jgi:hypothetical protein
MIVYGNSIQRLMMRTLIAASALVIATFCNAAEEG